MRNSNNAAMREALNVVHHIAATAKNDFDVFAGIERIRRISVCALAKPPRNCDVGTPDEQSERFENFCLNHIGCAEETGGRHCLGCPLERATMKATQKCELYWAQMPYEEGDAK